MSRRSNFNIMGRLHRKAKLLLGVVTGVIVGLAGGAVVMAAIPDGGGVIHACYKTGLLGNGAVRIIDSPSASCAFNETAISWNQQGPKGDTGPQGPAGAGGAAGHRVDVAWGDIPDTDAAQTVLSVPGFIDLKMGKCTSDGNLDTLLTNTAGQTVSFAAPAATDTPIATGDSYDVGDNETSLAATIILSKGSGSGSQTATLTLAAGVNPDTQTCYMYAQAN